ncbi:conserved hypothetical protein [Prochlorococcus marinus str. MIT 9202]|nr:conserved hypothetical protein [Prochlorococcus marinus str. MIT 9202]
MINLSLNNIFKMYIWRKLNFYLFKSYHRPSAKIYSLKTFFTKYLYSKSSDIFSERSALLKKPPLALEFYNSLGRIILYVKYSIFIIFTNNYPSSSELEIFNGRSSNKKNPNKKLLNPLKPFHLYDSNDKDIDSVSLLKNYKKHLNTYRNINGDSEWWVKCRNEFQNLFLVSNEELNLEALKNFRSSYSPSAAILNDSSRLINKKKSPRIQKLMSLRLIMLYHELAERINKNILLVNSESEVGNPPYLKYRNLNITQRNLRFSYYINSLEQNCKEIFSNEDKLILDIGGGYGGLIRAMYHYFPKNTYMICELPETLLLAEYFLRNCFSNKKFLHINDINFLNKNDKSFLLEFDFIFITPDIFYSLQKRIIDLTINTTSLCEMTKSSQQDYIKSIERCSNYFYSVNRYSSRKDKYDTIGIEDLKFQQKWRPLKVAFTHTYHLEFLGKIL